MSVCMDWQCRGGEEADSERSTRSARYSSTRSSWLTSPGLGSCVSQDWMLETCSRLRYLCCLALTLGLAGLPLLLAGAGLGAACQLHSGSEQTFLRNNLSLGTLMDTARPRILRLTFFLSPIVVWDEILYVELEPAWLPSSLSHKLSQWLLRREWTQFPDFLSAHSYQVVHTELSLVPGARPQPITAQQQILHPLGLPGARRVMLILIRSGNWNPRK